MCIDRAADKALDSNQTHLSFAATARCESHPLTLHFQPQPLSLGKVTAAPWLDLEAHGGVLAVLFLPKHWFFTADFSKDIELSCGQLLPWANSPLCKHSRMCSSVKAG